MKQNTKWQYKSIIFSTAVAMAFFAGHFLMGQTGTAAENCPVPSLDGISMPEGIVLTDELAERGTPFARHFRQPDGSVHAIISASPRWFKGGDGQWHAIDTTLEARDGGFASERNTFKTYFPGTSGSSVRIVTESGAEILYSPFQIVGGANVAAQAMPGAASGNRVGYDGVFPGAEEEFFVTGAHLKHNLVLQGKPAWLADGAYLRNSLEVSPHATAYWGGFPVVHETEIADGQEFQFKNTDGSRLFEIPAPVAYELNDPSEGVSMRMTLALVANGGYELSTYLPAEWLAAPGRQYPVVIDPTAVIQPSQKDANISQSNPTFNYGALTTIGIMTKATASQRMMLQFDLSSIPAGSITNTATLELWAEVGNQNRTYTIYRLTRDWVEGTGAGSATGDGATWNTYDGVNAWTAAGGDYAATAYSATAMGTKASEWKIWSNMATLINEWTSGTFPNYGMVIRDSEDSNANNEWKFTSKEGATTTNRPLIRLDYTPCAALTCDSVTVDADPVCEGTAQTFTANATGGQGTLTYEWDIGGDGFDDGTGNPISFTLPAGSHTVVVRVTDSCGVPQTCTTSINVTVNVCGSCTTISASAGVDAAAVCLGTAQNFTGAGTGEGALTYEWDFLYDGVAFNVMSSDQNPTYTYASSDSFTARLRVTDSCTDPGAQVAVSDVAITINTLPTPAISGATTRCAADVCTTLDAGAGYASYSWSTGATSQTICVSPAATTDYTVTVTDGNGCQGTSAIHTLTVNANPTPTITPSGATTFCAGGSVDLDAGAGYASYSWSTGETTQVITVSTSATYTVTVTDGNGCSGQDSEVVAVNANPTPTITESACDVPTAGNVTLDAGVWSAYLWSTGATTQTIVVPGDGTSSYTVTVTDGNGCQGTSPSLTVSDCSACVAPGEVSMLVWADFDSITWGSLADAATYNLYRGSVENLLASGWPEGACHQPSLLTNAHIETESPAAGTTWFYLVTGESACGADGSLGTDSDGNPRAATTACL